MKEHPRTLVKLRFIGGPRDGETTNLVMCFRNGERVFIDQSERRIHGLYQVRRFLGESGSVYYLAPKDWPSEQVLVHLIHNHIGDRHDIAQEATAFQSPFPATPTSASSKAAARPGQHNGHRYATAAE